MTASVLDVTDADTVAAAAATVPELDVLVNNAFGMVVVTNAFLN